jgi:hypothetical protein
LFFAWSKNWPFRVTVENLDKNKGGRDDLQIHPDIDLESFTEIVFQNP